MCVYIYILLYICIENAETVVDYLFFGTLFALAALSIHFSNIYFIRLIGHMRASACTRTHIRSFIIPISAVWHCYIVAQLVVENFHFVSRNTVPFNTHRLQQFFAHAHTQAKFYSIIFGYLFFRIQKAYVARFLGFSFVLAIPPFYSYFNNNLANDLVS